MSEKLVEEMVIYQQLLSDSLANENGKDNSINEQVNLNTVLADLEKYMRKLKFLQKEMTSLSEQSCNLKKRAQHLQHLRQQEDERFANEMERVKQMEQLLKPVKSTKS